MCNNVLVCACVSPMCLAVCTPLEVSVCLNPISGYLCAICRVQHEGTLTVSPLYSDNNHFLVELHQNLGVQTLKSCQTTGVRCGNLPPPQSIPGVDSGNRQNLPLPPRIYPRRGIVWNLPHRFWRPINLLPRAFYTHFGKGTELEHKLDQRRRVIVIY